MHLDQLIGQFQQAKDWEQRKQIASQIEAFGEKAIQPLINIFGQFIDPDDYYPLDSDANRHSLAEDTLIAIGKPAVDALLPLLSSNKWGEQFGAIYCLHHIGAPRAIQPMILSLDTNDINVVSEISEAMDSFGEQVVSPLLTALHHSNPKIRAHTAQCLRNFRQDDVKNSLIELALHDTVYEVRESAIVRLSYFEGDDITQILQQLINDSDADIRELAQDMIDDRNDKESNNIESS